MRIRRIVGAAVGMWVVAGCASVQPTTTPQAAIAKLEAQRQASPKSVGVLRALGVQYYKEQRYPEARAVLADAATVAPNDGVVALYRGLTAEAMNDLPAAREAYSSYLKVGRTQRVRRQLEARLADMQRRELQAAAKAAVQAETQLSGIRGNPTTVAVMPFRFVGADSNLKPLERGFAELLTTDLAQVKALTVVERSRLASILAEVNLSQTAAVDSSTALRAGKIIQAGTLVQGQLTQNGDRLRTDAALVNVATSAIAVGTTPATDNQALDRLFEMEKTIALSLIQSLGVPITTAERNAIEQRPTRSLQAFLAYSQGLTYEDAGRFDDASRAYGNAARIDPSFGAASQKSTQTANLAAAPTVTTATVEAGLQGSAEGAVVNASGQGSSAPTTTTTSSAAQTTADQLNQSTFSAATGSGTTSGTTTPLTDPLASTPLEKTQNPQSKVIVVVKPPLE